MFLWIAFALLTAAVLAAVLAPLARPARRDEASTAADGGTVAVYRDQLQEIQADHTRGVLSADEAEAARLEVSRRLLASAARAEDAEPAASPPALPSSRHATIALATAVVVPLLTLTLYLAYGSPGQPARPFAARTDAAVEQAALAGMIAQVEARLRENPGEGRGWEVIAPVYLKLGRFRDAANAYANAARLNGETVVLLAGRAEAAMLASDGVVTEEARVAYEKILKLEPGRVEARFWLAMAREQDGRLADALADYQALLAEAPPDADYRAPLTQRIQEVTARIAAIETGAPAGPTEADMAAAAKLTPQERAQMIAGMVDGLAQRLKRNGRDLAGWLRLLNAYAALDRKDEARAALAEARRNFAGDAGALAELAKLANSLGLGS
ncbi:MAG: c-type cytochrome biogenesis protein CcmI [Hyphomonadaceae bacterium]|nr:c-type cytochrome biogenesis protein CcmI [Hyphomonadaceae bacterium]